MRAGLWNLPGLSSPAEQRLGYARGAARQRPGRHYGIPGQGMTMPNTDMFENQPGAVFGVGGLHSNIPLNTLPFTPPPIPEFDPSSDPGYPMNQPPQYTQRPGFAGINPKKHGNWGQGQVPQFGLNTLMKLFM